MQDNLTDELDNEKDDDEEAVGLRDIINLLNKSKTAQWQMPEGAVIKSPIKSIRLFCLGCMGGNSAEVNRCTAPRCFLFAFRFGRNPFSKNVGNLAGPAALKKWREANQTIGENAQGDEIGTEEVVG